ncbi:hypothetical protein LX36DRAFT_681890 [Colletotrichum falcatum]|nr:hypothetical protein LX36DRAFT_681890 [Colletotrichum falcatum]
MPMEPCSLTERRRFTVLFVLGSTAWLGQGDRLQFFAREYSLVHFSVGDNLRTWMKANRDTPLASTIQDRLDNQGFLTSSELNPFLGLAVEDAMQQKNVKGIVIDGFPSCDAKPDVVLLVNVARDKAETRYLARARDRNDSADKFARRFAEYLEEGPVVEKHYREAGLLVEIDNNGTKEESIAMLQKKLGESSLWRSAVVD